MSLTAELKNEIAIQNPASVSEARAECSVLLRFAGGLHVVGGRILIEAEVDTELVAKRLQAFLERLYRVECQVIIVSGGALRKGNRYVVRVVKDSDRLARSTGLIDSAGRPVRGLPTSIVGAGKGEAAAAWRGAFLARGSLVEPGRSSTLEVTCPGPESALAMVGCARRLGATAKGRDVRGTSRVTVRDTDAIAALLEALGAPKTFARWQEQREKREARGSANRLANFDDANLRRSARAAVAAGAKVERAFEILGDDVPDHLLQAGKLRLQYKEDSLEELGQKSEPPLTKDAVAGRIRRLLALADKVAEEKGIPGTEAAITPEMLEDE
ncbi:DNA-binding protein WhiA [Actinomycetaceae bacterium MB13-C1-2]|nr:DNA-binding protein WhiA [Actinomycetaceae bacterium MB13-C1-2]